MQSQRDQRHGMGDDAQVLAAKERLAGFQTGRSGIDENAGARRDQRRDMRGDGLFCGVTAQDALVEGNLGAHVGRDRARRRAREEYRRSFRDP